MSCIKQLLSKSLNGQMLGALAQDSFLVEWGNLSSKCNNADGRLAACPSGGPQIRRSRVGFLGKVADIPGEIRLAATNLRAT